MIKWLIQDTARSLYAVHEDFDPIMKLNYPFQAIGVIPFTNTITGIDELDPNDTYIIRGGTKIVGMLSSEEVDNVSPVMLKALKNGISYDHEKFDQDYYSTLNLPLLNDNSEYLDLSDDKNLYASFSTAKFVKPSSDLKAFTAGILEPGEVLKYFIENGYYRTDYLKEKVLISSVKEISGEFRFICINGEVITGSRYRHNNQLVLDSTIPIDIQCAANEYAKLYQPSDIYTMDLAETPHGIKIVEYNCWNGSGLYKSNKEKLFSTINEYYKGKL